MNDFTLICATFALHLNKFGLISGHSFGWESFQKKKKIFIHFWPYNRYKVQMKTLSCFSHKINYKFTHANAHTISIFLNIKRGKQKAYISYLKYKQPQKVIIHNATSQFSSMFCWTCSLIRKYSTEKLLSFRSHWRIKISFRQKYACNKLLILVLFTTYQFYHYFAVLLKMLNKYGKLCKFNSKRKISYWVKILLECHQFFGIPLCWRNWIELFRT